MLILEHTRVTEYQRMIRMIEYFSNNTLKVINLLSFFVASVRWYYHY